jgi:hypothetical protein
MTLGGRIMSWISKIGGAVKGGVKGIVKRSVAAGTGGLIAGGSISTISGSSEAAITVITALTTLMGVIGNLIKEYRTYRESIRDGNK